MSVMLEKIKKYQNHPVTKELRDVRVVGFVAFGIIVMLVSWNTVGVIQTNYDLQKRLSRLQQQNEVYDLENQNLKLKNEYYNSDQYLELTARKQFGKAAPGERVYIVPKNVALQHTVPMPEVAQQASQVADAKPAYQRNFESWMNFFFHRGDQ